MTKEEHGKQVIAKFDKAFESWIEEVTDSKKFESGDEKTRLKIAYEAGAGEAYMQMLEIMLLPAKPASASKLNPFEAVTNVTPKA